MTTDVDEAGELRDIGDSTMSAEPDRRDAANRWWYRLAGLCAVAPIFVGAIRTARSGWIPTNDAAATVYRAGHSIGPHGSLLGLYAWPSSIAVGESTFSPGPWQLWWLWLPIKVLGSTWGPLLAMAVLNAAFFWLAGWCVRRRFGDRCATGAFVAMAVLSWSMGTGVFTSPVPVVAVAAPLTAFCFVAWTLANGDERSLPIAGFLVSYLVLCNPETAMLVPVIGGGALVLWGTSMWRRKRAAPNQWPALRRSGTKMAAITLAVTLVLWLPALVQQLLNRPGNLEHLARASSLVHPWLGVRNATAASVSLFAGPPFWLRGSANNSFLTFSGNLPSTIATVVTVTVLVGLLVGLGVIGHRRKDTAATTTVIFCAVLLGASWLHCRRSPNGQYFLAMWPIAMFVSFAIGFALFRALPASVRTWRPATGCAIGVIVLVGLANLTIRPIPHFTAGTAREQQVSAALNAQILAAVHGKGTVTMAPAFNNTFTYAASAVVALDDARIAVCPDAIVSFQGNAKPGCDHPTPGVTIIYRPETRFVMPGAGETVIARAHALSSAESREWAELSLSVRGGVERLSSTHARLPVTNAYRQAVRSGRIPAIGTGTGSGFVDQPALIFDDFDAQARFANAVATVAHATDGEVVFARLPGVSDAELLRWATLRKKLDKGVVVTMKQTSAN